MSLKQLFLLMGSVSFLMVVAVVYTKVGRPGYVSYGEVRAIDRLCQRSADDIMSKLVKSKSKSLQSERAFIAQIHTCLKACRSYLIQSRAKGVHSGESPVAIPECLLDPTRHSKKMTLPKPGIKKESPSTQTTSTPAPSTPINSKSVNDKESNSTKVP